MEKITNLSDSVKVITWNRRVLRISGIWPLDIRDLIFLPYFTYGCLIISTGILSLLDNFSNFDYVLSNLTENTMMLTTLMKLATFRINGRSIGQFLKDILQDFSDESYKNAKEKGIIFYYNKLSYKFAMITIPSMSFVLIGYFLQEAASSLIIVIANSSTTFQLCMSGYHILVCLGGGGDVQIIVFLFHATGLTGTLFVYCYIGECLIQESTSLDKELYHSEWYNMSPIDLKSIHICMMRARKPLQLTSAKFCALSLYTFTDILKTSMGSLHIVLGFLDLIDHPPTLDHVVTNVTENIVIVMVVCKLIVYRLNSESIAQMIIDIQKNFVNETYRTKEERLAFLSYNRLSFKFIQIVIPSIIIMSVLHIIQSVVPPIIVVDNSTVEYRMLYKIVIPSAIIMTIMHTITSLVPPTIAVDNSTVEYRMLYKVRPIIKPRDTISYILVTMYQMLFIPIVIPAYIGTDCLFSSSAIQITSQFAVLRCKVTQVLRNSNNLRHDIKKLVLKHLRLIKLAETFENDFNIYICQQMIGTTFNLCLSGYHALVSSTNGETVTFVMFIVIPSVILISSMHTITRLVPPTIVVGNSTVEYRMLYKIRPIIKPHDTTSYILVTMYQMIAIPIIISANIGTDCLFNSSALQITSQFAVLRCKVTQVLRNSNNLRHDIKQLVLKHHQLIRLAETLENDFNIYICQQMIAITFNLCISGYHALVSSNNGDTTTFVMFVWYAIVLLATLLSYCYIGECLIEESMGFSESLYLSEWYELSPMNLKMIYICMIRGRIPLQLTSAKFFTLSLNTFTKILKTSMGYLSVLKTLL
ncbi:hypothetical protein KPH14_002618 [Odynerus spinipes]|uniref:Odorant receptor n=1 Tax=Odynerus spinipes TaxID=1348599 RepID=A0AAD9R8S5_9HYME|nr:hypothetical protein KPH14_002618 [Odynerus spinipes]